MLNTMLVITETALTSTQHTCWHACTQMQILNTHITTHILFSPPLPFYHTQALFVTLTHTFSYNNYYRREKRKVKKPENRGPG